MYTVQTNTDVRNFRIIINLWSWEGYVSLWIGKQLKSLNAKTDISTFINLRYLRSKLLKNKEYNKKICHIFHHNFKNIPCYAMSEV